MAKIFKMNNSFSVPPEGVALHYLSFFLWQLESSLVCSSDFSLLSYIFSLFFFFFFFLFALHLICFYPVFSLFMDM